MWKTFIRPGALALAACAFASASAQEVSFKDPVGDDDGPGKYVYPTDPVYKKGSFDLTGLRVVQKGDKLTFEVSVNSDIEDPWGMPEPAHFSVQMPIVFVKTGPGGQTKGLPGLNVQFAKEDAWTRVVILSPQPAGRVRSEVKQKAADLKDAIVVPDEVTAEGRTIRATVDRKLFGEGDITKWGYQVVMQSNEGFPDKTDLLTRKVNEYEGQHRFGGGNDGDCDPHVMDVLAGKGKGDKSEIEAQHQMLSYECGPDGSSKKMATLRMVYSK
jgi:carbohydrate-binding DOMON domain-containing protein